MDKKELKKEIDVLIESIKKQADRMNVQDNLSMVELEVLHHKIQKLYEKSILIHHLPAKIETTAPASPISTVEAITGEIGKSETRKGEESPIIPASKTEPLSELLSVPMPEKEIRKAVLETVSAPDLFGGALQPEPKIAVKGKPEKERGLKALHKPIPDLQKAFSVNDKFRFINELFHGNGTEFNIAINQVNSCGSYEDADRYVSNLHEIYGWKEENEVVNMFLDLVERRFL